MASSTWTQLVTNIQNKIYQNNGEYITGEILQGVLLDIITFLKPTTRFGGIITPLSAAISNLDTPCFFIANLKGTYTNFGGITIANNGIHKIYFNGTSFQLDTETSFLDSIGTSETNLMHQNAIKTYVEGVSDTLFDAITELSTNLINYGTFNVIGAIDGTNKDFKIDPLYKLLTSKVWIGKVIQYKGIDYYEIDNNHISFASAPKPEEVIHFEALNDF